MFSISTFEIELWEKLKEKTDSESRSATRTSMDGFQTSKRLSGPITVLTSAQYSTVERVLVGPRCDGWILGLTLRSAFLRCNHELIILWLDVLISFLLVSFGFSEMREGET